MFVGFWKLPFLNCLSPLAHWLSLSHFVFIRLQWGSMKCGLRVETAGELRDMLRIPELGPELCSVLSFCQADPLGQPHTHIHVYILYGYASSILKRTPWHPGETWFSLGCPLTSLGPLLRKDLFTESPFPHHQPFLSSVPLLSTYPSWDDFTYLQIEVIIAHWSKGRKFGYLCVPRAHNHALHVVSTQQMFVESVTV